MKNIGNLLANIGSEHGRALVVKERIGKDQIPDEYVDSAIGFFETESRYTHDLMYGAKIAKQADRKEKFTQIYEKLINDEVKNGNLGYSARIADELEMFEDALNLHLKASTKNEKQGKFYWAANEMEHALESAKSGGRYEFTKEIAKRIKNLHMKTLINFDQTLLRWFSGDSKTLIQTVKDLATKAGMEDKIQEVYDKIVQLKTKDYGNLGLSYESAARFAEEVGMTEKAKELRISAIEEYVKDKSVTYALDLIPKVGGIKEIPYNLRRSIVQARAEAGNSDEVAELAEELGLLKEVNEFYLKAIESSERQGEFDKCATYAKKIGLKGKAKKYKNLAKVVGKDHIF